MDILNHVHRKRRQLWMHSNLTILHLWIRLNRQREVFRFGLSLSHHLTTCLQWQPCCIFQKGKLNSIQGLIFLILYLEIVLYYQIKTLINFWCRRKLNSKSLKSVFNMLIRKLNILYLNYCI